MSQQLLSPAFPASQKVYLQTHKIGNIEIDVCPLSGGIWFDRFEIKKFDEAHEPIAELLSVLPKNPIHPAIMKGRLSPRHPEATMQQQPYGPKGAAGVLTVDVCPVCAGIWLDYNELQKIRELYPTEAEKNKLAQEIANNAFKGIKSAKSENSGGLIYNLLKKI